MANTFLSARLRSWLVAVWRFVAAAPFTYGWLTVLLFTTIIQHELTGRQLHVVLIQQSTNVKHLAADPHRHGGAMW